MLHGSQPDAIIVCHDVARETISTCPDYQLPGIQDCIDLHLQCARIVNPNVRCIGVSVNTSSLSEDKREEYLQALEQELGLIPVLTPLSPGATPLIKELMMQFYPQKNQAGTCRIIIVGFVGLVFTWYSGLVFQSVIVGGGYGTGREITEFFLVHGALGGFFGMLISRLVWGAVLAVAFELARITKSYNYKSFFQALLGRFWWLFEVIYLLIALLVLGCGRPSAAGEIIISQLLDVPAVIGVLTLMLFVGILTFFGSKLIERVFVGWSALLFLTLHSAIRQYVHQF